MASSTPIARRTRSKFEQETIKAIRQGRIETKSEASSSMSSSGSSIRPLKITKRHLTENASSTSTIKGSRKESQSFVGLQHKSLVSNSIFKQQLKDENSSPIHQSAHGEPLKGQASVKETAAMLERQSPSSSPVIPKQKRVLSDSQNHNRQKTSESENAEENPFAVIQSKHNLRPVVKKALESLSASSAVKVDKEDCVYPHQRQDSSEDNHVAIEPSENGTIEADSLNPFVNRALEGLATGPIGCERYHDYLHVHRNDWGSDLVKSAVSDKSFTPEHSLDFVRPLEYPKLHEGWAMDIPASSEMIEGELQFFDSDGYIEAPGAGHERHHAKSDTIDGELKFYDSDGNIEAQPAKINMRHADSDVAAGELVFFDSNGVQQTHGVDESMVFLDDKDPFEGFSFYGNESTSLQGKQIPIDGVSSYGLGSPNTTFHTVREEITEEAHDVSSLYSGESEEQDADDSQAPQPEQQDTSTPVKSEFVEGELKVSDFNGKVDTQKVKNAPLGMTDTSAEYSHYSSLPASGNTSLNPSRQNPASTSHQDPSNPITLATIVTRVETPKAVEGKPQVSTALQTEHDPPQAYSSNGSLPRSSNNSSSLAPASHEMSSRPVRSATIESQVDPPKADEERVQVRPFKSSRKRSNSLSELERLREEDKAAREKDEIVAQVQRAELEDTSLQDADSVDTSYLPDVSFRTTTLLDVPVHRNFLEDVCHELDRMVDDKPGTKYLQTMANNPAYFEDYLEFDRTAEPAEIKRMAWELGIKTKSRSTRRTEIGEWIDSVETEAPNPKSDGRLFVKVLKLENLELPVPPEAVYFACTMDNGIHEVTTEWLPLSRNAAINQEFMLLTTPGLEFTLTLKIRIDPTYESPEMQRQRPKSGLARILHSPRKATGSKRSEKYMSLMRSVGPDGAFAKSYIAFDSVWKLCDSQVFTISYPCLNEWSMSGSPLQMRREGSPNRSAAQPNVIGGLLMQMLYAPATDGLKAPSLTDADIPKNISGCMMALRIAEWHQKKWYQGPMAQLGGGTTYWKRRHYELIGGKLVARNEITKQLVTIMDLSRAVCIADDRIIGSDVPENAPVSRSDPPPPTPMLPPVGSTSSKKKQDGTRRSGRKSSKFTSLAEKELQLQDPDSYYPVEKSFRIVFRDGQVISFYTDTEAEKQDWLKVIRALIGKVPPNNVWAARVLRRRELENEARARRIADVVAQSDSNSSTSTVTYEPSESESVESRQFKRSLRARGTEIKAGSSSQGPAGPANAARRK